MKNKKQKAINNYIRAKHTQDECSGFIDGYEQAERNFFTPSLYIYFVGVFTGTLIGLLF